MAIFDSAQNDENRKGGSRHKDGPRPATAFGCFSVPRRGRGPYFRFICSTRAVLLTHKSYTDALLMIFALRRNSKAQGAVTNQLGIIA